MRILFLSRWFPFPPDNGSKLRIYNLLQGLAAHHNVSLISFADRQNIDPNVPQLRSICREVQVVPWKPFNPHSQRARLALLTSTPRSVADTFSAEMKESVDRKLATGSYDLVIASQIDMANYSPHFHTLPALFEEVEIGVLHDQFSRAGSPWRRFRSGLTWAKHRRYLASLLDNFRACTVVSRREQELLSRVVTNYRAIEVIPNCVNLQDYEAIRQVPQRDTLIFTGSFSYFPNYEAMGWFLQKVYPKIQAQVPDVHLTITGDNANRALPPARNITLTGFVDDVRPLIARSWGSVVPLHSGGGTRLKILEAMALGTPVVTTSKGAEGLDVEPEKHLLIADTPDTFATSVIRLMREPELRERLADNAYRLVRTSYDWTVVMPHFLALVERVVRN